MGVPEASSKETTGHRANFYSLCLVMKIMLRKLEPVYYNPCRNNRKQSRNAVAAAPLLVHPQLLLRVGVVQVPERNGDQNQIQFQSSSASSNNDTPPAIFV